MGEMADYYREQEFFNDDGQRDGAARRRRVITKKDKQTMADVRRNRFYVGSASALTRNWGHAEMNAAIAHAKEILEEGEESFTFVVKIVKVVKRASRPTVVVDV